MRSAGPDDPISITDIEQLCSDPRGLGERRQAAVGLVQDLEDEPEHVDHGALGDPDAVVRGIRQDRRISRRPTSPPRRTSRASFEECVIHYGDTTGKVLTTLYDETQNGAGGSGYVSAVALEETSLLNYNQGNPDSHTVQPGETLTPPKEKLVAVYPRADRCGPTTRSRCSAPTG